MPRIPSTFDIWSSILNHLDPGDVAALARSNRHLRVIATPRLYQTVKICNDEDNGCRRCPKADTLSKPYVSQAIERFSMYAKTPLQAHELAVITKLLTAAKLTHFWWMDGIYSTRFPGPPTAIVDLIAGMKTLRDVSLWGHHNTAGFRTSILTRFTGLTSLALHHLGDVDPATLKTAIEQNPLTYILLNSPRMRGRQPLFASQHDIPRSSNSSYLRHIYLGCSAPVNLENLAAWVSSASNLEIFCIEVGHSGAGVPLIRSLSPRVRRIKWYCWSLPAEGWIEFARTLRRFSGLRKLSIHEESVKLTDNADSVCDVDAMVQEVLRNAPKLVKLRWDVGRIHLRHVRALLDGLPDLRRLKTTLTVNDHSIDNVLPALTTSKLESFQIFLLYLRSITPVPAAMKSWESINDAAPPSIMELVRQSPSLREITISGLGWGGLGQFTGVTRHENRVFKVVRNGGGQKVLHDEWKEDPSPFPPLH